MKNWCKLCAAAYLATPVNFARTMLWMDNMMNIWRKCGGRKMYADGGETNDDG